MQELQRDLTAKGVVWLLVNSVSPKYPSHRSPEAARKEWASQKINATAWLDDSSGAIGKAYGMRTTPHMFVIDQAGVLVYEGAIDDRPSPDGDPRTAHNYVREAVQKLAGRTTTGRIPDQALRLRSEIRQLDCLSCSADRSRRHWPNQ